MIAACQKLAPAARYLVAVVEGACHCHWAFHWVASLVVAASTCEEVGTGRL